MLMGSLVAGLILTVITLLLTLLTISKGYSFKHTVDPINEEDKTRVFTGDGKRL